MTKMTKMTNPANKWNRRMSVALAAAAMAGIGQQASALVVYNADTTLTTGVHDRFHINGGAVVDVPVGNTATISSGDTYPTSYAGSSAAGGGTLDVFGTMNFATGLALGAGDDPDSAVDESLINIYAGGSVSTAGLYVSARAKATINIWGTLLVDKGGVGVGGTNYDPGIAMFEGHSANGGQGTINQYAGSLVQVTSPSLAPLNLGITTSGGTDGNNYNMLGGTLSVHDILNSTGGGMFNYSGGTVIIEGQDRTGVINENWWNGAATAIYNGQDTIITPEPASLALLGLGGMMLLRRRRDN